MVCNRLSIDSIRSLIDYKGTLSEIAYALDQLQADGVAMSSSYGTGPHASKVIF